MSKKTYINMRCDFEVNISRKDFIFIVKLLLMAGFIIL
ncbi:hypothetical protein J2X31_001458 [Flavobacterium arsenatis]|uniref:Uncharacterized protein n=1 Tax=Flavobacterium arsenatis TaxID=1484332 RepID=A0ABU1TPY3_9FLAO|nr:hypothetical protein [Flavobacterium arsenatis]